MCICEYENISGIIIYVVFLVVYSEETISYRKLSKGQPGLTSPFDGKITNCSTNYYAFTSYEMQRNLRVNLGMCGTETSDWGSGPPSFLFLVWGRKRKFLSFWGSILGLLHLRLWLCLCTTVAKFICSISTSKFISPIREIRNQMAYAFTEYTFITSQICDIWGLYRKGHWAQIG